MAKLKQGKNYNYAYVSKTSKTDFYETMKLQTKITGTVVNLLNHWFEVFEKLFTEECLFEMRM